MQLQSKYFSEEVPYKWIAESKTGRPNRKNNNYVSNIRCPAMALQTQQSGLDCCRQRLTLNEAVSHAKQQDSQQSSGEKQKISTEIKKCFESWEETAQLN